MDERQASIIEELPQPGGPQRDTGSQWSTTVSTLGAGIAIGVVLMLAIGSGGAPAPSSGPTESAGVGQASPSTRPSASPSAVAATQLAPDAQQSLIVDGVPFHFDVPQGWWQYRNLYISKSSKSSPGAEAMIFWASFPFGQYAWLCNVPSAFEFGQAPEELASALAARMPGTELVEGPTEVSVGGLKALQVVLFVRDDEGCGPGFFYGWDGGAIRGGPAWGGPLLGDTITVWLLDPGGAPFIVAAESHLNAGAELEAEVQQIVDSIEFEPGAIDRPWVRYAAGTEPGVRQAVTTDGVSFTYSVPAENWARYDELYVSKDTTGSQTAEAMVLWARYPDGQIAQACNWTGARPSGATAAVLATSLSAGLPGTDLILGPSEDTVGGVAAVRVELSVRDEASCGLGYFLTWRFEGGGPFWNGPERSDALTIWVLDIGGSPFVILAETRWNAGNELRAEVEQIVDSIEFR